MLVEKICFFFLILNENCGLNRGEEKIIFFCECVGEISNYFCRCYLLCENVIEIDIIFVWVGLFDFSVSKVKEMIVCLKYRNNFGRYW